MIEVIDVAPDWRPEAGRPCAVVEIYVSGHAAGSGGSTISSTTAIFRAANNGADIANAIDEARAWASENGVSAVYVKRERSPSR